MSGYGVLPRKRMEWWGASKTNPFMVTDFGAVHMHYWRAIQYILDDKHTKQSLVPCILHLDWEEQ